MDNVTYALLKKKIGETQPGLIAESTDAWLEENITQETGYVLDRSLSMSNAAAPADLVGAQSEAIEDAIALPSYKTGGNVVSVNKPTGMSLVAVTDKNATKITVVKTNLWDEETRIGNYSDRTGNYQSSGTNLCNKNPIKVNAETEYYFVKGSYSAIVFFYKSNLGAVAASDSFISYISLNASTHIFTTPENCAFVNFYLGSAYGQTYHNDMGINYPKTETTYKEYDGIDYPVNWQRAEFNGSGEQANVFSDSGEIVVGANNFAPTRLDNIVFVGGAIRNSGDGWSFINNDAHTPINCSTVIVNQDEDIVISYSFTAEKVVSFVIACDETFTSGGYTIGASVGLTQAVCSIYQNGNKVNASELISDGGNFWFIGIMQI